MDTAGGTRSTRCVASFKTMRNSVVDSAAVVTMLNGILLGVCLREDKPTGDREPIGVTRFVSTARSNSANASDVNQIVSRLPGLHATSTASSGLSASCSHAVLLGMVIVASLSSSGSPSNTSTTYVTGTPKGGR